MPLAGRQGGKVASAMREVHQNIPSTVPSWVRKDPKKREAMLRAIAFSKARKRGAKV